jgi:DNA-binding transcriptional ArsR family regulator
MPLDDEKLAQAEPAQPEPAQAEPAQPEPAQAEPAQAEPAQPEPAQPEPTSASPAPDAPEHKPLRTITDAQTMRALAHPVRISILEALAFGGGSMTATQVGEQIDESPTTCSFHLRQLAKYGFVEEAGGGKGRARPWRITTVGFNIPATHDDPETDIAATVLGNVFREHQLRRYQTWRDTRSTYPLEWREAANDSEYVMYLTPDELNEVARELHEVLMPRFQDGRLTDPSKRPLGSVPVELMLFAYPLELPKTDAASRPSAGRPSAGRPSAGRPSAGRPSAGENSTGGAGEAEGDPR